MKKFLKLQLPASPEKLPPADIDAAILAAGAIKARRIRCKKTAVKMLPAIGLTSAAAAAALFVFVPSGSAPSTPREAVALAAKQQQQPNAAVTASVKAQPETEKVTAAVQVNAVSGDMLKLGDTTELEQANFNMAVMSDFPSDTDIRYN